MISFDVFDTILTRAVGDSKALFLLLGQRLAKERIISLSPEGFAIARIESEARSRKNHPDREITLDDIMEELSFAIGLDPTEKKIIEEYEKSLEIEVSSPVPGVAKYVDNARKHYGKVIFISDMYLPEDLIRHLLQLHSFWKPGDSLYVSSTHGVTKSNGILYRLVAQNEGIDLRQLTHFGDNVKSDICIAQNHGMQTKLIKTCHLNRFERLMEDFSKDTVGLSSVFAAASRMTRLSVGANSRHEVAIRDVAAGVAAPVICSYVLWILNTAKRIGIKRLYFVSRDGQILLKVAQIFSPLINFDFDLRYLYVSRQALHLPSIEQIGLQEKEWILESSKIVPIESVLARVDLTLDYIKGLINKHNFKYNTTTNNNTHSMDSILDWFLDHPEVQSRILAAAKRRRAVLLDYLRQEGLFDDVSYALVDIGWKGRCQRSLAHNLKMAGRPTPPNGFYFGLAGSQLGEAGNMQPFFFDRARSVGYMQGVDSLEIFMEIFCQADHGSVTGYRRVDKILKPELGKDGNSRAIQWGVPLVQQSIEFFSENLAKAPILISSLPDLRPLCFALLTSFCNNPTVDEAKAWCRFPYNDDQTESSFYELASPYKVSDVLTILRVGNIPPKHNLFWMSGAFAQTPRIVRDIFRLALEFRNILSKILKRLPTIN